MDIECLLKCTENGDTTEKCLEICKEKPAEEGGEANGEEGGEEGGEGPLKPDYILGGLVCYMPEMGIGAASYHFVSAENNYISYENAPFEWGGLDNGTPFPDQVQFQSQR